MNKKIVILGAGGHARVVMDILLQRINLGEKIEIKGILDDSYDKKKKENLFNIPIIGKVDKCLENTDYEYIIAIGSNKIRKKLSNLYNLTYYTAIHPKAIIGRNIKIEEGTVIMAGTIINSYSEIGKHCIINTGSVVEHDCKIKDYVHISPNTTLCGSVEVGSKSWIGAGSTVIQGLKVGEDSTVGAGSVVVKNIEENITVVGNPAHKLR